MKIKTVLGVLLLALSVPSVLQWCWLPIGNTFLWWSVDFIFLSFCLLEGWAIPSCVNSKNVFPIKIYLFWVVISCFRGLTVAKNYWEYKNLIAGVLFLFLPVLVYAFSNRDILQTVLRCWFKAALFLFILIFPFLDDEAYGRFLFPFSFMMLFFKELPKRWRIIFFIVYFLVCLFLDARSNVIKFVVAFLGGMLPFFAYFIRKHVFKIINGIFLFLPFVLLGLGVTGIFNIFKVGDFLKGNYTATAKGHNGDVEYSLVGDTRTSLYGENFLSAVRNNYLLFGRTPARGYESQYFGSFEYYKLNTGEMERFSSEVSILNFFTWLGIVGCILYFAIFAKATHLAISKSNNIYIKVVGLYVSFRWLFGWIEDFSRFDLNMIFLWIAIAMCFSSDFRGMSDLEFSAWVKGIFSRKRKQPYLLRENVSNKKLFEYHQ